MKTKDMCFLWITTVALAITKTMVWESLTNGNSFDGEDDDYVKVDLMYSGFPRLF